MPMLNRQKSRQHEGLSLVLTTQKASGRSFLDKDEDPLFGSAVVWRLCFEI